VPVEGNGKGITAVLVNGASAGAPQSVVNVGSTAQSVGRAASARSVVNGAPVRPVRRAENNTAAEAD